MSLFDAFTGDAYKNASEKQQQYLTDFLNSQRVRLATAQNQGIEALQSGQYGALGSLGNNYGAAANYVTSNFNPALAALTGYTGEAKDALTSGRDQGLADLRSGVTSAVGAYSPLLSASQGYLDTSNKASQAQMDALGLNGPEGIARAQASFQASPGYQFQLGQGIDAAVRGGLAAGMGASGNTAKALSDYGSGLASTEFYKNYLPQIQQIQQLYAPLASSGLGTAGSGQANAYLTGGTGAANIDTGTATQIANLLKGTGTSVSGLYTGEGSTLADLSSKLGNAMSGVYTSIAPQIASLIQGLSGQASTLSGQTIQPNISALNTAAAGDTGGSANLINLIGGLLTGGASSGLGGGLASLLSKGGSSLFGSLLPGGGSGGLIGGTSASGIGY